MKNALFHSKSYYIIALLITSLFISSCSKKEDPAPQNSLPEDPMQTETISGIFPLEVQVPGVYVTSGVDKVGFCEERKNNICMIIRYGNKIKNNIPECTVVFPINNSFVNYTERSADVLAFQYIPTTLNQNDLTSTFSLNADGSYRIKGISIKNNQNYLFDFNVNIK